MTSVEHIAAWLGERVRTEYGLARAVRKGLKIKVLRVFVERGITKDEFHHIVIPARTYKHRQSRHEPLSMDESDKAVRSARVLAQAEQAFGNREKALSWMRKAKQRFEGETPMEMLQTEAGARLVEEMLIQIDQGMFA